MKLKFIFFLASCSILVREKSLAQDDPEKYIQSQSISIILDQDAFTPYNEDRNYTMGVSVGYSGKFADKNYLIFPWVRKKVDWLLGLRQLHSSGEEYLPGLSLMVSAFTPENLISTVPVTDDRPYGSIVALSSSRSSLLNGEEDEIHQRSITTRLNIGLLGTSLSREIQSHIHREQWLGSTRPVPLGWHNQISGGGEPTLLYQIQYALPGFIQVNPVSGFKMFECIYHIESNLGYYTNLAGGVNFRLGRYKTPFWYLNSNGMSSVNQGVLDISNFEFFFTFGIRVRGVVYNGLLQGQFRNNPYALTFKEINPLIIESELGAVLRFKRFSLLLYPLLLRTSEINLPTFRTHIWGNVSFVYSWSKR